MTNLLNRKEVAKLLQVSPEHVTHLFESGELSGLDVASGVKKQLRFTPDDVDAFIAERKSKSTKTKPKTKPKKRPITQIV